MLQVGGKNVGSHLCRVETGATGSKLDGGDRLCKPLFRPAGSVVDRRTRPHLRPGSLLFFFSLRIDSPCFPAAQGDKMRSCMLLIGSIGSRWVDQMRPKISEITVLRILIHDPCLSVGLDLSPPLRPLLVRKWLRANDRPMETRLPIPD